MTAPPDEPRPDPALPDGPRPGTAPPDGPRPETAPPDGPLTEAVNERIFRDQIVPLFLTGPPAQRSPVVVIVGGQTGAGKTAVTGMVQRALGGPGGFTTVNMDFYNPMHPSFDRWQAEDEATASARVRPDGERWWAKAQQYAIEQRHHVVLESAMRDPSEFEDIAARFRGEGYRVEVALLAVPPALSRLGILNRYLDEVEEVGHGRYIDPAVHDECCDGVLRGAAAVDEGGLAHTAFAFRRSGEVVYANHAGADDTWREPARLAEAVEEERHRPWTEGERAWYERRMAALRDGADPRWRPELDAIDETAAPLLPARADAPPPDRTPPLAPQQALDHDAEPVPQPQPDHTQELQQDAQPQPEVSRQTLTELRDAADAIHRARLAAESTRRTQNDAVATPEPTAPEPDATPQTRGPDTEIDR